MKTKTGLVYESAGESRNQPIIFVHGFPFDRTMWDPLIAILADQYFCVSYDCRGLGESESGDGQYTMDMFAEDLIEVCDAAGLEAPVVCGLSMGGYIAFRAAELFPDRFSAYIFCDTRSDADSDTAKIRRMAGIKQINSEGVEPFVRGFVPNCFGERYKKNFETEYNQYLERCIAQGPLGVKGALLAMLSRKNVTPSLAGFTKPALVLVGEQDTLTPVDEMRCFSGLIPDSVFAVIPECGHMLPIESPKAVAHHIEAFLQNGIL